VGPTIIREIDEITRDSRLRLIGVRPGEPEELESCRKHTAVFEVEADFARIANLLYRLERPPYQLWVEGVDINSERTTGNQVRAKVSIAVYTLKPVGEKSDERA